MDLPGIIYQPTAFIPTQSGVKVTYKDFKYSIENAFVYNLLFGNLNEAFLFKAGPQQPLSFNSISGTRDSAVFVNHFETDIQAPLNWWGTSDTTMIDSMIFDHHDLGNFRGSNL